MPNQIKETGCCYYRITWPVKLVKSFSTRFDLARSNHVSSFFPAEPKSVPLSLFFWLVLGPQTHSLQQCIHHSSHLINCLIKAALRKLLFGFSFLWWLMPLVARPWFNVKCSKWLSPPGDAQQVQGEGLLCLGISSLFWDNWPWRHHRALPEVTPVAPQPITLDGAGD